MVLVLGHFPDLARLLVGLEDTCELWLVADDADGLTVPYARVLSMPMADRSELARVLRAQPGHDRFGAVLPGRERFTTLAAGLAHALGVRPDLAEAYQILEDKHLLRVAARAAGLGRTFFALAETAEDVRHALGRVGPDGVIVKPPRGNASRGVTHLLAGSSDEAVAAALAAATEVGTDGRGGILIEEFVAGEGYSVEVVVEDGRCTFANVTGKTLSGPSAASPFIPIQHTVPAVLAPSQTAELIETQLSFIACIGADTGLFHGEWQIRPDGTLYLIECAARFPGGGLGDAAIHSYGVNLAHRWVRALLGGSEVAPLPVATGHTASLSFLAPRDGQLRAVHGLAEVQRLAETISVIRRAPDGSAVRRGRNGADRLLTVTIHAPDSACLTQTADLVRALVRVEVA